MAAELELQNHYKAGYYKLLDELKIIKCVKPHVYDDLADVARHYREWAIDMAKLDSLPDVPPK